MPVLVWGNGACDTDGAYNSALLQNIASYGFFIISEGTPNGSGKGTSNAQTMSQAIDWVTQNAGKGAYANVDASKIMAAGFSCGGVEAMDNIWDSRVDTVGIVSSGLLTNYTAAKDWRKPVLFVLGGQGDIAYPNVSIPPYSKNSRHAETFNRESVTSRISLLVSLRGKATFLSVMEGL
jgi:dienelactone hydrolase